MLQVVLFLTILVVDGKDHRLVRQQLGTDETQRSANSRDAIFLGIYQLDLNGVIHLSDCRHAAVIAIMSIPVLVSVVMVLPITWPLSRLVHIPILTCFPSTSDIADQMKSV